MRRCPLAWHPGDGRWLGNLGAPEIWLENIGHWIGFVGKIYRKPWFLPSNLMGFPVKIFPSSNSMNIGK